MEIVNALQILAGFAGGAAAMWLIMDHRRLAGRVAELERAQSAPPAAPAWA